MAGSKAARILRQFPVALRRDLELRYRALGSEGEHFLALVTGLVEDLQPEGLIEHILVGQAADHAWHIARQRQIETILLASAGTPPQPKPPAVSGFEARMIETQAAMQRELLIGQHKWRDNTEYLALKEQFEPEMHAEEERLREEARQQKPQASPQVVAQDHTPMALAAAYIANSAPLEKINRGIALSESRFAACLKELERYRAARRSRAGGEASPILDAEFTEVAAEEPRDIATPARSQPAQRSSQHRSSHHPRQGERGPEQPKTRAQRTRPAQRSARKGGV